MQALYDRPSAVATGVGVSGGEGGGGGGGLEWKVGPANFTSAVYAAVHCQ